MGLWIAGPWGIRADRHWQTPPARKTWAALIGNSGHGLLVRCFHGVGGNHYDDTSTEAAKTEGLRRHGTGGHKGTFTRSASSPNIGPIDASRAVGYLVCDCLNATGGHQSCDYQRTKTPANHHRANNKGANNHGAKYHGLFRW
jgi:hypothetical protein